MASFDPSVISQIPDSSGNPLEARAKAFKLADLMTEQQRNKMLLSSAQEQETEKKKATDIFKGFKGNIGTAEGNTQLAGLYQKAGLQKPAMEALQLGSEQQIQDLQKQELRNKALQFSVDYVGVRAKEIKAVLHGPGGIQAAHQMYAQALQGVPPEFQGHLPPKLPDDPQQADQLLDQAMGVSERAQKLLNEESTRKHQETEDKRSQDLTNIERSRLGLEKAKFARTQAGGGKPPAGYEWDPNETDKLRYIKGGPKDPDTTSNKWSGREKVYSERVITAANEAARAISNITELPVGASTGFLGVGKSPGSSILGATKDALRNKMSSQEVQDYNTMLAGVRRNMATIESTGLAPPGSLSESMGSVELREGDTQFTKLRKLAELRQISDAGLEVQLADPAIPEAIKDVARKALDTIHKAVPFTHHDVTQLQANPEKSLQQLIKDKGLGGKGGPEVGTVQGGYRFKGGDPSQKQNWEKVSGG